MSMYNAAGTLGSAVGAALTAALGVGVDGNVDNLARAAFGTLALCNVVTL